MKRRTRGGYWTSAAAMDFGYEVAREHFYNRLGRYTLRTGLRLLDQGRDYSRRSIPKGSTRIRRTRSRLT